MSALLWNQCDNMSMLTDFYELTMSQAYFDEGLINRRACFDLYFRTVPESGGYAVMAGVEQLHDFLSNIAFSEENLDYLRSLGTFSEAFLDYLRHFEFSCDVWAVPEGTPVFPNEPIVRVEGPMIQAQLIETMLLLTINHQTLIATKASRIVRAAQGRPILEFGARRAQGYDAATLGARAAYIAGVAGSSCTIAGEYFGVPLSGTMAHSFVLAFPDEYTAFSVYARRFPEATTLLIDTYNTLQSGLPNAIRVAQEVLAPLGQRLKAVRIDSGDLTYLTVKARAMLDEAGLQDCRIVVSNALDEYLIRDLLLQGAQIDAFGVGERLITSRAEPVLGGVYKLAAIEEEGVWKPTLKISDNFAKITTPCAKKLWRLYDSRTGMALADVLTVADEVIEGGQEPYEIFDPLHTWKRKTLVNFEAKELLEPLFSKGCSVYERPSLETLRQHATAESQRLWESMKRFENPQTYYVDLSEKLWQIKDQLLRQHS